MGKPGLLSVFRQALRVAKDIRQIERLPCDRIGCQGTTQAIYRAHPDGRRDLTPRKCSRCRTVTWHPNGL